MAAVAPSEERVEIEALYRKHDPAKLVEVDDLVAKYGDFKLLGKPHDHRWHLGCILPRVPTAI